VVLRVLLLAWVACRECTNVFLIVWAYNLKCGWQYYKCGNENC